MPKGVRTETLATCRACGTEFLTTRCGKAAFYCRRPECDEQRQARGFVIPNTTGPGTETTVERVARQVLAMQARQRRDRDRFERQWRREVEAWLPRLAVQRAAEERRIVRIREQLARQQARLDAQAERRRARAVTRASVLSSKIEAALRELRQLERTTGTDLGTSRLATGTLLVPAATARAQVITDEQAGDINTLMAAIRDRLLARPDLPVAGRNAIQRAVIALARAEGLPDTHAALQHLAAEALAWDRALPQSIRLTDIDSQAMRDAA